MKKRSLLFLLCVLLLIVVLALCLIFNNKINNEAEKEPLIGGESNNISFELASQNPIYMHIGSEIEILDEFFIVKNADINNVSCEVCSYYNSDTNRIKYENKKITASAVDSYKLKFSLNENGEMITREILLVVEDNPKITQTKSVLNISKSYNLNDIYKIDESIENFNIETSDTCIFKDNQITTVNTGETTMKISFVQNAIKTIYDFNIKILPEPKYQIKVENISAKLTDEYCMLEYKILDEHGANILNQVVDVQIENNSVVEFVSNTAPTILLKINGVGSTNLTIVLIEETTIFKTIEVNITN